VLRLFSSLNHNSEFKISGLAKTLLVEISRERLFFTNAWNSIASLTNARMCKMGGKRLVKDKIEKIYENE